MIDATYTTLIPITVNGGEFAYWRGERQISESHGIGIGDTVNFKAFTDAGGKRHDAVCDMRVVSITVHACKYGSHVHLRATGGGFRYIESRIDSFELGGFPFEGGDQ